MRWFAFSFVLLVMGANNLISQDIFNDAEKAFGPDPLLYNGKKYSFFVPPATEGNQYLSDEKYSPGMIVIKGSEFNVTEINYDIYNQEILLRYLNETGGLNLIALSQSWIECFFMYDKRFELITLPGKPKRIFQVIRTGELGILIYWSKQLKLDMAYGSDKYVFSSPLKEFYIQMGDGFTEFKNNRTFTAAFGDEAQDNIRKYMKQHHINVKKSGDMLLSELINFCEARMK